MRIGNWDGIRFATTFRGRHGTTRPALGQDPPQYKTLHSGLGKRWRTKGSKLRRFVELSWPGLFALLAGRSYLADPKLAEFWIVPVLLVGVALWASVLAFEEREPLGLRLSAGLVNLAFPVYLVFWIQW